MTGVLYAIGKACAKHRFVVLGVWLVVAVVLVGISKQMGDNTNDNLSLPGTNSQQRHRRSSTSRSRPRPTAQPDRPARPERRQADGLQVRERGQHRRPPTWPSSPNVASVVNPLTPQGARRSARTRRPATCRSGSRSAPARCRRSDAQDIIDAAADPAKAAGLEVADRRPARPEGLQSRRPSPAS